MPGVTDINPSMVQQQAMSTVGSIAGIIQTLGNLKKAKAANAKLDRLFKERKAFQTPDEVYDILNMTTNAAQTGYSPDVLSYLTGQAGSGLSTSLGTAERLGADPNAISGLLNNYFQDIFKIGGEDEMLKLGKFDKLINATQLLASNKEAEQISKDNLIKDQMAATAAKLDNAEKGIQSGLNLTLNAMGTAATANSYSSAGLSDVFSSTGKIATNAGNISSLGGGGLTPSQLLQIKQMRDAGLLD